MQGGREDALESSQFLGNGRNNKMPKPWKWHQVRYKNTSGNHGQQEAAARGGRGECVAFGLWHSRPGIEHIRMRGSTHQA